MKIPKALSYVNVASTYNELRDDRAEYEAEWRTISDYLLPGRGIYQTYSKPRKRKLTSPKVVNNIAEDALLVLTSGMHGGLTSPSRPWFKLAWEDPRLNQVDQLKTWIQKATDILHFMLHASNFYSVINNFYVEYAGFGTAACYVGEDTGTDEVPFYFNILTVGEYAFSIGPAGRPNQFCRTIFMSERQLVERFGKAVSKRVRKRVETNQSGVDIPSFTVLEYIGKYKYDSQRPWTQIFYEVQSKGAPSGAPFVGNEMPEPLEVNGFYEFPYPLARWSTIGSDTYGLGPGSRALPDIKRLQEMEKAFLMATHKAINPPLNAPARMKGKLNTLPGGYNYYSNPQETVNEIYTVKFDYMGVSNAVERVEQRIRRNFFNDIFLTANRDPNATPYKAMEVTVREQEKMLRLGPVIEGLQSEFLSPLIERCFNILLRKELLPPLDPALAQLAGSYHITLVSPLATAQRGVALHGINSFLAFVGQAAQFDQRVLDKIDTDKAVDEYADITGVQTDILRPDAEVQQIRKARAKAQAQEKAQAEQMAQAQLQSQLNKDQAQAAKLQAEAGATYTEGQQARQEAGIGT